MSALGQKQTCAAQKGMSALPPKADMCGALPALTAIESNQAQRMIELAFDIPLNKCRFVCQILIDFVPHPCVRNLTSTTETSVSSVCGTRLTPITERYQLLFLVAR
jgi:hypothetical protein